MNIEDAEKAIASVLRQLEIDRGLIVKSLELYDIEATKMQHNRRHFVRAVRIECSAAPGMHWSQLGEKS